MGQDDKFYQVFTSVQLDSVKVAEPTGGISARWCIDALREEVTASSGIEWTGVGTGGGDRDMDWQVQGTGIKAWNKALALANSLDQAIGTAGWTARIHIVKHEGKSRAVVRDVRLNGYEAGSENQLAA